MVGDILSCAEAEQESASECREHAFSLRCFGAAEVKGVAVQCRSTMSSHEVGRDNHTDGQAGLSPRGVSKLCSRLFNSHCNHDRLYLVRKPHKRQFMLFKGRASLGHVVVTYRGWGQSKKSSTVQQSRQFWSTLTNPHLNLDILAVSSTLGGADMRSTNASYRPSLQCGAAIFGGIFCSIAVDTIIQ